MRVETLDTSGLGDRSYVVVADGIAVVIDPQRDIDRVLSRVDAHAARITHVLETHLHNDYVTGGLELARTVGAEYVVPAGEDLGYQARRVGDGDVVDAGPFRLRVLHTPGHTLEHVSYALDDAAGRTVGVFTGGSMLFDATGRTDLLGDEHTRDLTEAQFRSIRRLADELPDDAQVYPTHGFGSFCSATAVDRDESTVSEQRQSNPALTNDEETFVEELLAGLSDYPAYYAHMGVVNREGPEPVDLSRPRSTDVEELRRRIEAGEWVVDLRHRTAFAAGHLGGSFGFELSDSFVNYLGWLYAYGTPLSLIGADEEQIDTARRELARIGVDRIEGAARIDAVNRARSYPVADFAELAARLDDDDVVVLDVRRTDEYDEGHVRGALNIALHHLAGRLGELPGGQVWVHCASGYRASVAASILDRGQVPVVLIDDEYATAAELGITTEGS
ncbi:MAG: MBL fold metallo-hydrolase [Mycolicibacterium sp.]|nr:MBL fold metallo-hydrolase [Mycolicibacterium sp.]